MDWNVLGHEWAAEMLATHIARGETRHAYLFAGPPGVGRRTLALRFAQALNCLEPPAPGMACGTCRACRQIERMQQADLSVVQALDDDGNPKEGGSLKIDQFRDLQRSLSLAPYESKYRIALLLRCEEAGAPAQNAFLKTLEEPPARAVLLLTAVDSESLLPTIASRCEILRLRPLPVPQLEEALQARWKLEAGEARKLAHLAGGRVGYALRLHADPRLLQNHSEWLDDLQVLLGGSRRQRFGYVDREFKENKDNREKLRRALSAWLTYWHDVLLVSCGSSAPLTNLEHAGQITRLARQLDPDFVRRRVSDLEEGIRRLDANANVRLLAEVLLLDWPKINL